MKKFKCIVMAVAVVTLAGTKAHGQISFGAFVGTAGKIISQFLGTTTVTPAWGLNTWDYSDVGTDLGAYSKLRQSVYLDPITGKYFYTQITQYDTFPPVTSQNAFPIGSIVLESFNCITPLATDNRVETYTVWVTCTVSTTGYFPPQPPYQINLKTTGTKAPESCTDTNVGWTRPWRKTVKVDPTNKPVITTVGYPTYGLSWPFFAWAGEIYLF